MNYPILESPAGIRLCFSLGQDWLDFVAGALLSACAQQLGVTLAFALYQLTGFLLGLFPVHRSAGIAPRLELDF